MQEARSMTLIEHLTLVEETRSDINRKHDLIDVMFLVISAHHEWCRVLSGL